MASGLVARDVRHAHRFVVDQRTRARALAGELLETDTMSLAHGEDGARLHLLPAWLFDAVDVDPLAVALTVGR